MDKPTIKKKDFQEKLTELLSNNIVDMSYDEKINYIYDLIMKYEIENENLRDISNKRKSWKDDELKIILLDAPTKYNCLKYAKIFKRGYGSIEQIYRWASTPFSEMSEQRKNDRFIQQIKKIAKDVGFRA